MDPQIPVVNAAKGIEKGSLLRLSEVAQQILPDVKYAALSGPSHAEEVARALPTTVVTASTAPDLAMTVQDISSTDRFRALHSRPGRASGSAWELGGALENIIALGSLGFQSRLGARRQDESGDDDARHDRDDQTRTRARCACGNLRGAGWHRGPDRAAPTVHSRNRRCGILIGQGKRVADAVKEVGMVVEGLSTAEAATALAQNIRWKCRSHSAFTT